MSELLMPAAVIRKETSLRRISYEVRVEDDRGADWMALMAAVNQAHGDLRDAGVLKPGEEAWPGQIRVLPMQRLILVLVELSLTHPESPLQLT